MIKKYQSVKQCIPTSAVRNYAWAHGTKQLDGCFEKLRLTSLLKN